MTALRRLVILTRREYFADFFITPPITAAIAAVSISHGFGLPWLIEAACGWAVWTLYEYWLHRVVLHSWPGMVRFHALHHKSERDYIALHPILTLAFYAAGWLTFGARSSAFMVGFSAGYVVYAALHTIFHYAKHPRWLFRTGRERHAGHHACGHVNFGVSTGIWDRLFRTHRYVPLRNGECW